mmetsp:Transcript_9090/g.28942  ORF Transcript_9090/g.28942 Transcript_9090/m.28942 type:complete len:244 (+) Transcript_9090:1961-2692(+)
MNALHQRNHASQLGPNQVRLDERTALNDAASSEGNRVLDANAHVPHSKADAGKALLVEVHHDGEKASIFLADDVGLRHHNIVKGKQSSARRPPTLGSKAGLANAGRVTVDEQERDTAGARTASPHRSDQVVSVQAARDKLLGTVHDKVALAVANRRRLQVCNVRPTRRLGHSECRQLVARQNLGHNAALHVSGAPLCKNGRRNGHGGEERGDEAARRDATKLVVHNENVKLIDRPTATGILTN